MKVLHLLWETVCRWTHFVNMQTSVRLKMFNLTLFCIVVHICIEIVAADIESSLDITLTQ